MNNIKSPHHRLLKRPFVAAIFFLIIGGCWRDGFAQVRPTILDSGDVKESRRQPGAVDRSAVTATKASRAAYGVLVVLTEPKDAEISINGKPAGKAINGKFTKELPANKSYSIGVSAGADFQERLETITLQPRKPSIVEAALPSTSGILRIFPARDGVRLLDNQQPIPAKKLGTDKDNRIVLDRLTPGKHTITYDLPGYLIYERTFEVVAGNEYTWNLVPERAVVELRVVTDPKAVVYVDGKQVGITPANGVLKTPVELGKHEVKLAKDDFEEYAVILTFEYDKPVPLERRLVPLPTSTEFNDDFDLPKPSAWTMPASGAIFKGGRLELDNATSLCTPTNYRYRDFEMNFHLKLGSGASAAWALRIKDSKDYYLFYLSGPEGLFPNRFNTYIVHNNQFDKSNAYLSSPIVVRLVPGGQYDVHITATGNRIVQQIKPADTGKVIELGFFEDPDSTLLLGGIGFRTVGAEKFSIDELLIKPR